MKSAILPKDFPNNTAAWEKLIAEAPGEDRPPTPEEKAHWERAVVARSLPELREKLNKARGSSRNPLKVSTTIRFDSDVLAAFKSTGKGWQTRMNDALKAWLKEHHGSAV